MKLLQKGFKILLICSAFFIVCYIGIYAYAKMLPTLPIDKANSYYLYDDNKDLFQGKHSKKWVSLDEISPHLINATIAIEDKSFYHHQGFDFLRILKSLYINFTSGKTLQGASTISQQYAKNLFLDFDKTWKRKINEAWLTIRLEAHYSKDKILEGYLNTINYGGIFGIENASLYYFGKNAKELTLAEATILAGIPKDPTYYSPIENEQNSKRRQKLILSAMVKNKYITVTQAEKAAQTKLVYQAEKSDTNLTTLMYYQDAVIQELQNIKTIPTSFLKTGGLKIYTNFNLDIQTKMEQSIKENLKYNPELEVASVVMNPNNGKIVAIAGGRDYSKSQYNRVTKMKRQVGSSMKPFLYYAALENGFTPSTTFKSEKTTFTFSENKTYSPNNYGNNYPNKPISMATALAYSDNIYAVKTHLFLGEQTLIDISKRLGITSPLSPIPSLALGTESINILEMMKAYATFANEGYTVDPYFIEKVEDIDGNVLYEHKEKKENILNRSLVYILNEMLNNSYANEFVDYNYPTCINLAPKLTKKYAIKTGTTETDHLIFGYNHELIMGMWAGYDNNQVSDVKDGNAIKNIWAEVMEYALKDIEGNGWYDVPQNVVGVLVEPVTGKVANTESKKKKMMYYIKGTEPYDDSPDLDALVPTVKQ